MKLPRDKKETAIRTIASNKKYIAGLHVAAGRYLVGPEVVDDQLKRKSHVEEVQSKRDNKKVGTRMPIAYKVYAIRILNKQPAKCTVAQTKTISTCYKRAGDLPLPTAKQLLINRYHDTKMHGDTTAKPVATVRAPLPQHPLVSLVT